MADEEKKSGGSGETEPVQLYRFKVRTSDGREMVSAVAVVDPNAEGEGHDDAANTLEELEQKHKAEEKAHKEEMDKFHEEEQGRHASDVDAHHEAAADKHLEALDTHHEAQLTKNEHDLALKHAD